MAGVTSGRLAIRREAYPVPLDNVLSIPVDINSVIEIAADHIAFARTGATDRYPGGTLQKDAIVNIAEGRQTVRSQPDVVSLYDNSGNGLVGLDTVLLVPGYDIPVSGFRPADDQRAGSTRSLDAVLAIAIEYSAGPVRSDKIPPDARVPRIATHPDAVLRIRDNRIASVANIGIAYFRVGCAADSNAVTQVWIYHATGHKTDAVADNPVARGRHTLDANPVAPVPADDIAFARAAANEVFGATGNPDAIRTPLHQSAVGADPAPRHHVFVSGNFQLLLRKTVQIQIFYDALTREQLQTPAAVGKPRPQKGGAIPVNHHLIASERRQLGHQDNHVGRAEIDNVRARSGIGIQQRLPKGTGAGIARIGDRKRAGSRRTANSNTKKTERYGNPKPQTFTIA